MGRDRRGEGDGTEEEESEEIEEGSEAVFGTEEEAAGFSGGTEGEGCGRGTKEESGWIREVLVPACPKASGESVR